MALFISFSCFKFKMFFSDKDNNLNTILTIEDIIEERNIWGIWYNKLKAPFPICILCIVSSLKKNALIVKYKEKDDKNNANLSDIKL